MAIKVFGIATAIKSSVGEHRFSENCHTLCPRRMRAHRLDFPGCVTGTHAKKSMYSPLTFKFTELLSTVETLFETYPVRAQ